MSMCDFDIMTVAIFENFHTRLATLTYLFVKYIQPPLSDKLEFDTLPQSSSFWIRFIHFSTLEKLPKSRG